MNLYFSPNDQDDIFNTTIQDSATGSTMYTIETPKYSGGVLATTATRRDQVDGSTRFAFRVLWKGGKSALEDAMVVLDHRTLDEIPVRFILKNAPGSDTFGALRIDDVEYRWKSRGTGSKVVLVDKGAKNTVAQSHSRIQSSFFRKPRDMSLEISEPIAHAVDVVLLTFFLSWRERQREAIDVYNL